VFKLGFNIQQFTHYLVSPALLLFQTHSVWDNITPQAIKHCVKAKHHLMEKNTEQQPTKWIRLVDSLGLVLSWLVVGTLEMYNFW
jgi:hypothetical protein